VKRSVSQMPYVPSGSIRNKKKKKKKMVFEDMA
jgi:hypothetical protein